MTMSFAGNKHSDNKVMAATTWSLPIGMSSILSHLARSTLAQSTDESDLAVVGELIRTLGVDAPFGTSVDVAVDLVLAKEVELRPPPPPPEKSQLGRFHTELVFKMHLLFQFMGTQLSYLPTMATIHIV